MFFSPQKIVDFLLRALMPYEVIEMLKIKKNAVFTAESSM